MNFIDRRLNPKGKSLANRQRFVRVAQSELKEAVARSLEKRTITDIESGEKVSIPTGRIHEPRFRNSATGGKRDIVLPGNVDFVEGDTIPRPPGGAGGGGGGPGQASPDGRAEDMFQFTLTRDEFLSVLFDGLELPNLVKTNLKDTMVTRPMRSGLSVSGSPSNLNLKRTMRNSMGRRLALHRPRLADLALIDEEIAAAEARGANETALAELRERRERMVTKMRRIPFIDPVDARYNRFTQQPKPNAQAVVFFLMDVSGSMTEAMKQLAKRFFLLLNLFLHRHYRHVDIVFIRHTSEAQEVDEQTFFGSRETGGTVVSSALKVMREVIEDRYSPDDWNIYAAQASDGDNFAQDSELCSRLLTESLLPVCQFFAYIEVYDERETAILRNEANASELWRCYRRVAPEDPRLAMKRVFEKKDIYPVFEELFTPQRTTA